MRSLARTVTSPGSGPGLPSPDRGVLEQYLETAGCREWAREEWRAA